ncbi:hypothetical protein CASFOL_027997 [Castilleja foliolosa]|uniref:Uncharacterized protein n=1 Tax=Castilleja foliolosa TaxID=1961234 RepID=A0ABD3CI15_9LAMI
MLEIVSIAGEVDCLIENRRCGKCINQVEGCVYKRCPF